VENVAKRFAEAITTGSIAMDLACGGIGPGRVYVNAGPYHSGKSTEFVEVMKDLIRRGIRIIFNECEGAFDWEYAHQAGLPITFNEESQLWEHPLLSVVEFESGDAWFKYISRYLRTLKRKRDGGPQVAFLCDSASVLVPEGMANDEKKSAMAAQARMYSEGFMRIRSRIRSRRVILAFTNHIKEKPMAMGDPRYMKGGTTLHEQSDIISWITPSKSKTKAPKPQPTETGGICKERTLTGKGKDFFVYANHIFKKCRQRGALDQKIWVRICFRSGDGGKLGIDPSYDLLQYLIMTGQGSYTSSGRVSLKMHDVQWDADVGDLSYPEHEDLHGVSMYWRSFRRLVERRGLDLEKKPLPDVDIMALVRKQMTTGWAYLRYIEVESEE